MPSAFELNPTFSFTLLGTFVIYMWTRPPRWSAAAVLILSALLRTACMKLMGGFGAYYGVGWISWGAFLGIASLIVLAVQVSRSRGPERKSRLRTFHAAAVFPLCSLLFGYTVPLNVWLRPRTYDAFLLAFDGSLGFQPSFALGRLLLHSHTAWGWTTVLYYALPLAGAILYASHRASARSTVAILALLLSVILVGFALYSVYPAAGPRYAFAAFYPKSPPNPAQIMLQPMTVPDSPRNCMPSLHLAGALVIWWNARIWPRWGRLLAGLFLLATAFSTLALGEHYLVDLVVAFPFTLLFQAAWTSAVPLAGRVRRKPLWVGGILTMVWMVLLRYGLPLLLASRLLSWSLLLFTVVWCMALENALAKAARTARSGEPRAGLFSS